MTLFGSFYPCSQEAQDPGDGTCPTTLSSTPSSTSHSCELSVSVPGPPVRIVAPPAVLHQVSLDILCVHSLCLYLALTFTTYTLTGYSFRKPRPLAICHCTLRISLWLVQQVRVPHSETSKQDPRRS